MLFCLASGTDWERAGVTHATAQQLLVRGLIDRDQSARRASRRESRQSNPGHLWRSFIVRINWSYRGSRLEVDRR